MIHSPALSLCLGLLHRLKLSAFIAHVDVQGDAAGLLGDGVVAGHDLDIRPGIGVAEQAHQTIGTTFKTDGDRTNNDPAGTAGSHAGGAAVPGGAGGGTTA